MDYRLLPGVRPWHRGCDDACRVLAQRRGDPPAGVRSSGQSLSSRLSSFFRLRPLFEPFRDHHWRFWNDDRELFGWTPEECIARIEDYRDAGCTHIMLEIWGDDRTGQAKLFGETVLQHFKK